MADEFSNVSAFLYVGIVLVVFHRTENLVICVNSSAQMVTRFAKRLENLCRPVDRGNVAARNVQSTPHLLLVLDGNGDGLPSRRNCLPKSSAPNLVFEHCRVRRVSVFD